MRAVLDVNVLISAILAPTGAPSGLLLAWQAGAFEMIVSPALLAELAQALGYSKLRKRIPAAEADEFVTWLTRSATIAPDPDSAPPVQASDPGDDYLLALASDQRAILVSGDSHLLALANDFPIVTPARFRVMLSTE